MYTEVLGILQEDSHFFAFQQVAVHAGVVAVSSGGLLHTQVQFYGCVAVLAVDAMFQQGEHHGIHTVPVGLSAGGAVAVQEEEVAQLG